MKTTNLPAAFAVVILCACTKEETAPNDILLPVYRQMYAEFSTVDTSALRVEMSRATQGTVTYSWKNINGQTYVVCTDGGNQGNVYRNDTVKLYGNVQAPVNIAVRLDNVQSFTVHLDPSMNGQVAYQFKADW